MARILASKTALVNLEPRPIHEGPVARNPQASRPATKAVEGYRSPRRFASEVALERPARVLDGGPGTASGPLCPRCWNGRRANHELALILSQFSAQIRGVSPRILHLRHTAKPTRDPFQRQHSDDGSEPPGFVPKRRPSIFDRGGFGPGHGIQYGIRIIFRRRKCPPARPP